MTLITAISGAGLLMVYENIRGNLSSQTAWGIQKIKFNSYFIIFFTIYITSMLNQLFYQNQASISDYSKI